MEPEQTPVEQPVSKFENLHKVTPLSKYLAMALFVLLPFIGGYIGYSYALEKLAVVEIETSLNENLLQDDNENIELTKVPSSQTNIEEFNVGSRDKYNRRERYDLYSVVAYRDRATDEIVVNSSVLGKHRDDAEVILRSTSPLLVGAYKETKSFLVFEVLMDSVLYKGTDLRQLGGSIFTGQKKWFYVPLSESGNPLYAEMRELILSQIGVDENNPYIRNLYGLADKATDWNVKKAAEKDLLLISKASCSECGGGYTEKVIIVDLTNLEAFFIEGRLAYIEWTDGKKFRYKLYPGEGDSEYQYITQDRESGIGCGMGGCPKTNINWDNVAWQNGSI